MAKRRACGVRLVGCVAAVLGLSVAASGQVRPVYGGHALDANFRVGSGGLNRPVRQFVPNSTNLLITGNMTGGRAFRGFSPIRDPSQLFVGLPSSSLSMFERDSTSIADVTAGRVPFQPQPYFAPSQTVTDIGAIRSGLNQVGSSMPLSPYAVPRATVSTRVPSIPGLYPSTDPRPRGDVLTLTPVTGATLPGRAALSRLTTDPRLGAQVRPGALPPIIPTYPTQPFGRAPGPAIPGLPGVTPVLPSGTILRTPLDRLLSPPEFAGAIDTRIEARVDTRVTAPPIDTAIAGADATRPRDAGHAPDSPPTPGIASRLAPVPRVGRPGLPVDVGTPLDGGFAGREEAAPPTLPGAATDEPAPEPRQPASPGPQDRRAGVLWSPIFLPAVTGRTRRLSNEERAAQRRALLDRPVTSLVGVAQPAVDELLKRAENLLRTGQFYRAAGQYQVAQSVDPESPLPMLGKGHALIGSGDYLAAVFQLGRAIRRFPELPRVQLDLPAMMSGDDILERRRADLEQRLAANLAPEDRYRLQFLLGYIELYSGLESFGRNNVNAAAAAAPEISPIKRFAAAMAEPTSRPAAPPRP